MLPFIQLFADDLVLYNFISQRWLEIGKPICKCAMCNIINVTNWVYLVWTFLFFFHWQLNMQSFHAHMHSKKKKKNCCWICKSKKLSLCPASLLWLQNFLILCTLIAMQAPQASDSPVESEGMQPLLMPVTLYFVFPPRHLK